MIDPQSAAQACRDIECRLAAAPIEVLQEARRRHEIEEHNAKMEQAKQKKNQHKILSRLLYGGNAEKRWLRQIVSSKSINR